MINLMVAYDAILRWCKHTGLKTGSTQAEISGTDESMEVKIEESIYRYSHGRLHHDTLPAIEHENEKHFYCNGLLHKESGPAIITPEEEAFYIHGKCITQRSLNDSGYDKTFDDEGNLHSFDDQPSMLQTDKEARWHKHGKLHRELPLPAVMTSNSMAWWVDGVSQGSMITSEAGTFFYGEGAKLFARVQWEHPELIDEEGDSEA